MRLGLGAELQGRLERLERRAAPLLEQPYRADARRVITKFATLKLMAFGYSAVEARDTFHKLVVERWPYDSGEVLAFDPEEARAIFDSLLASDDEASALAAEIRRQFGQGEPCDAFETQARRLFALLGAHLRRSSDEDYAWYRSAAGRDTGEGAGLP
jgi:hypothetical protein